MHRAPDASKPKERFGGAMCAWAVGLGAAACACVSLPVQAGGESRFSIATYNMGGLYDKYDDPYNRERGSTGDRALEALTAVVIDLDADVLALQGVENKGLLDQLTRTVWAPLAYRHVVLVEGNDNLTELFGPTVIEHAGLDVAVLSRLSVGRVMTHQHLRFGTEREVSLHRFAYDLLEVEIAPGEPVGFSLYVAHLKDRADLWGAEHEERARLVREGEAREIRRIVEERLAASPDARLVLAGTFNSEPGSRTLKHLRGSAPDTLFVCPAADSAGFAATSYPRDPRHLPQRYDYLLCSPALAAEYTSGSAKVITGERAWRASPHRPVRAIFASPVPQSE